MTVLSPEEPENPFFQRWSRWIPLAVLVLVLFLSLLAGWVVSGLTAAQQEGRIEREVEVHRQSVREHLTTFDQLLEASRAFWLTKETEPSEASFQQYARLLNLPVNHPEVQALGFVDWTMQGGQVRTPIRYIAPPSQVNLAIRGFDMYAEPKRRDAIVRALRTGRVQATAPITLQQTSGVGGTQEKGFLLLLPVQTGSELRGLIYLAVRGQAFAQKLRDTFEASGSGTLPFEMRVAGELLTAPLEDADRPYALRAQPLRLEGQVWETVYAPPPSFRNNPLSFLAPLIALTGLVTAGVAFLLTQGQVSARERSEAAQRGLRKMQARQERARAEFESIFQSMQDAAAFTDQRGQIRLVNSALEGQFGLAPSELAGQPLATLHADRQLDSHTTFQSLTTRYRRADGSEFYGEAQRNEVLDARGQRLGLLEVVRDVSERVSAERAIQLEERRSRAVLDGIPHVIWVSDALGQVTYVNAEHRRRLGEASLREQVLGGDLGAYDQMWRSAYTRNARAHVTVRLWARPQGAPEQAGAEGHQETPLTERWYVVRVTPLFGESGEAQEWVASATDIHDQVLAERAAQQSEASYREALEGMPQIVWRASPSGELTSLNRRWSEYVGPEAQAGGLLPSLHPDDRDEFQQRWEEALWTEEPLEAEHRLRGARGDYRNFVTRALPIRAADGRLSEWVGTSTDVDDSVYAERSALLLADLSELLSAPVQVAAQVPAGASEEDWARRYHEALALLMRWPGTEGVALWTWPGLRLLAEAHGHWKPEAGGAALAEVVREAVRLRVPYYLRGEQLAQFEVAAAAAYPLIGRDGTVRGVLGIGHRYALTDRDHELSTQVVNRLTTALDNDALREQYQALQHSLEYRVQRRTLELEEANRELEAFSYSVSHDLRTPLRHVMSFGEMLQRELGELPPKAARYLGIILSSAGNMHGQIDSLLEFSRMSRQPLRLVEVDLGGLVERVWRTLEPERQGREIRFTLGPLPTVPGDPALLELVFQNLLSNAVKYTRPREQAEITLHAEPEGDFVRIEVRDNGVGFDPRYLDKLFGVFQRLHRPEEFEGNGVGLANVRRIVSRHGGQVSAAAQPGEGATFSVLLPQRPEKA